MLFFSVKLKKKKDIKVSFYTILMDKYVRSDRL